MQAAIYNTSYTGTNIIITEVYRLPQQEVKTPGTEIKPSITYI
jgi:hypothetical protein